ncbi:hypothetical protein NQ318_003768 [Aromia moschata]|uniref:Uncharacterized protein n=1 Tax=Aromia moschata TaxID=1265417 RepID=A0AAV8YKB1_9CUCU|nr:hypothetical protein NQ318_003768 [Aromia moschata]
MRTGKIEAQGTFQELSQSNLNFTKLLVDSNEKGEETSRRETIIVEAISDNYRRVSSLSCTSVSSSIMSELIQGNMESEEDSGEIPESPHSKSTIEQQEIFVR